jgi:hypothetical protein
MLCICLCCQIVDGLHVVVCWFDLMHAHHWSLAMGRIFGHRLLLLVLGNGIVVDNNWDTYWHP